MMDTGRQVSRDELHIKYAMFSNTLIRYFICLTLGGSYCTGWYNVFLFFPIYVVGYRTPAGR